MQANVLGIYRAIVTNNVDPLGTLRIKTICPQVSGTAELNWAEPANYTDPIPNTGDQVWIYFNGGETYKPVYLSTKNPYKWQQAVPATNWAQGPAGGTVQHMQYRFDYFDNVVLLGSFHTLSASPGSVMFTLPAAYCPKIEQRVPGVYNNAGTITGILIQILPNGNVTPSPVPAASGADVYINVTFPRGNIQ